MRQAENTACSIMFRKIRIAGFASGQRTQELFAKNKFPEERKHFFKPINLDTSLPQITVAISGSDCVSKPFFVCFHGSTTVWSSSSDLTRITRAPASLWQAQADRQDADISDRPQAITRERRGNSAPAVFQHLLGIQDVVEQLETSCTSQARRCKLGMRTAPGSVSSRLLAKSDRTRDGSSWRSLNSTCVCSRWPQPWGALFPRLKSSTAPLLVWQAFHVQSRVHSPPSQFGNRSPKNGRLLSSVSFHAPASSQSIVPPPPLLQRKRGRFSEVAPEA